MPLAEIQKAYAHLRSAAGNHPNKEDLLWSVADAITISTQAATGLCVGGAVSGLKSVRALWGAADFGTPQPNPYFVWNGFDDLKSPMTEKYMTSRAGIGFLGTVFTVTGSAVSGLTVVDGATISQGANALGSTAIHIYKLQALSKSFKQSDTLRGMLDIVISMKMIKAGMRGGQIVGGVLATGGIGSVIAGAASSAANLGIKATAGNVCVVTAFQLHWRAFQEQRLLGGIKGLGAGKGADGPALRILHELFSRRGVTRIFGKHDIDKMVGEPGGWMAIADKLTAM